VENIRDEGAASGPSRSFCDLRPSCLARASRPPIE
jgi:hypothetical protein